MNWLTFLGFLWLVIAISNAAPPEIGSAIKVRHISDTTADVTWARPAGYFVRYEISIYPGDGVNIFPPVVFYDRTPRNLLSNLAPSTNYTIKIWTVDSGGLEGKAKAASFTTLPPRVASINVSQITTTGAKLSWERPNGLFDHYRVTCQECIVHPSTVLANESNPQAILFLPTPGAAYIPHVFTVLGTTSSPAISRGFSAKPAPVDRSSVSVSRISTMSATVEWGQVTTGKIYSYVIRFPQGMNWLTRYIDPSTRPLEVTMIGLVPATKYNVTIQTSTHGQISDEVSIYFTTAQPDINITSITSTNATAFWTKSPGTIDYYNITIERNQPKEITVKNKTVPSTMSSPRVKVLGLVPGNTYRVHVLTVNGSAKGLVRSSEWFQTKPAAVASTTISVESVSNDSATLMWSAVTIGKVANYTITINPAQGGAKAYPSVVTTYPWKTELRNLTAATEYNIAIITNYGTMESEPATIKFQTSSSYPATTSKATTPRFTLPPTSGPNDASITLSEITTSSARVTWRAASGNIDSYIIAVSGGRADPSTVANDTLTTTLKGLAAGREYTVRIKTRVGIVDGITVTGTFITKPLAVATTSIYVKDVSANTATLTWGAVTVGNVDNYTITIYPTHGGASVYPSVVTSYTLQTELRSLTAATEYSVTIISKYKTEESAPATFTFQTRPNPVDATSISLSEITTSSARVTWRAVSGNVDSYIIAVSGGRADPSTVANDTLATTLRGLAAGREYTVTIKTRVGTVDGIAVTRNFSTRPSAVKKSSIQVEGITTVSATLTWGAVSDGKIDYYSFLIRPSQGGTDSSATVTPDTVYPAPAWVISCPVALRGLTSGTEYTITIKTKYGQLDSNPVEFNFTTELIPVDAASIFLTNICENSAKVTWDSVDGNFDHYIISIRPTTGGARVEPGKVAKGSGVLSTDLKNLTPGSFYIVTIRTVKGSNNGPTAHQVFQTRDPNHTRGPQASTSGSTSPVTTSKATTPVVSLPATSTTSKATTPEGSLPATSVPTVQAPTSLTPTTEFTLPMILIIIALGVAVICVITMAIALMRATKQKSHSDDPGGHHGISRGHMANPAYVTTTQLNN